MGGGFTVLGSQGIGLLHHVFLIQQGYVLAHGSFAKGLTVSRGQARPEDQPRPPADSCL